MTTSNLMESRRHELLSEVAEYAALIATESGIDAHIADQIGTNVANFLAEHWGGQMISFPKDFHFKLAARDMEIFDQFKGNNWGDLARAFNMTESGIRRVVQRVHKRVIKRVQPDLFNEKDNSND